MKTKTILRIRRFFRRFNPWLFLVCVLLAIVIWGLVMYSLDPMGIRDTASVAQVVTPDMAVAVTRL